MRFTRQVSEGRKTKSSFKFPLIFNLLAMILLNLFLGLNTIFIMNVISKAAISHSCHACAAAVEGVTNLFSLAGVENIGRGLGVQGVIGTETLIK